MNEFAYMIISNPGEDANSMINISWHVHCDCNDNYLLYTVKDSNFNENNKIYPVIEKCNSFDGNYSKDSNGNDFYEHVIFYQCRVNLTNLDNNTEYSYKIGKNGDTHYFKTGNDEFSVAWVSDYHAYTPIPSRLDYAFNTTKGIIDLRGKPDFILCGGDAIAWGGSYSFWLDMYNHELVKNYLWVNILGNHDYMSRGNAKNTSDYFKYTNNFPLNGYNDQLGICYYFIYGDCLFIVLNNEIMGFEYENEEVFKARAWVEQVLSTSNCKFKIVMQHYEWFQGITGESRKFGYKRWHELFDKYHVDLAIGNNNHIYVRSHPILNDKLNSMGTVYIQSPSSDNERGQELKELQFNSDIIASRFSEGNRTVGVLYLSFKKNSITIELFNRNIELIDSTTIKK